MDDILTQLTDPNWRGPMQHCRAWDCLDKLHDEAAAEIRRLRGSNTVAQAAPTDAYCVAKVASDPESAYQLLIEQDGEIQRLRAEIARLAAPVTDEALVEMAARAIARPAPMMDAGGPGWSVSAATRAVLATVSGPLRAAERGRCASLEDAVRTYLSANGSGCACGNGRVPVTAYWDACAAYAAAIRGDTNAG